MQRLLKKPLRLSQGKLRFIKVTLHTFIAGYLLLMFYWGFTDSLGADPVQALLNFTGIGAIHCLMGSLLMSPLAQALPMPDAMKCRRMLGVYAFVYALAHLLTYLLFELQLDWALIGEELTSRPYIAVGLAALFILFALTVTSLNRIQRRMGRRWQTLHNFVYLALILALLHFSWSQKTILQSALYYLVFGIFLLALRRDKFRRWFYKPQTSKQ